MDSKQRAKLKYQPETDKILLEKKVVILEAVQNWLAFVGKRIKMSKNQYSIENLLCKEKKI